MRQTEAVKATENQTTFQDVAMVAQERGISLTGCLPNCWEPDGVAQAHRQWKPEHVEQVEACRRFLRAPNRPTYKRPKSSYFLKHEVERWCGAAGTPAYVSNGAFLVACWLEGLEPRPENSGSPAAKASPNALVTMPRRLVVVKS